MRSLKVQCAKQHVLGNMIVRLPVTHMKCKNGAFYFWIF